jgi:hypothetical protein
MSRHASGVLLGFLVGSIGWANTYTVTTTDNAGAGSLRRAINDANARAGADTIAFAPAVSGGTIRPLTPLPTITDNETTINADIDADGAPDVTLNGDRMEGGMEGNWGLDIAADYCAVIGLAMGAIPGPGIILNGASHCVIHSCHIGVNRAGTSRLPNSLYDIAAYDADDNQIGSAEPAQRNVICGGTYNRYNSGILVMDSSDNTIIGNHIGVTRDGTTALGEGYIGVWLFQRDGTCTDNTVGGAMPEERNLFGGLLEGVSLSGEAESNEIKGNYLGLAADGSTVLPIQSAGVVVRGRRNVVGGTDPGDRNVFAGEAEDGVRIEPRELLLCGGSVGGEARGVFRAGRRGFRGQEQHLRPVPEWWPGPAAERGGQDRTSRRDGQEQHHRSVSQRRAGERGVGRPSGDQQQPAELRNRSRDPQQCPLPAR